MSTKKVSPPPPEAPEAIYQDEQFGPCIRHAAAARRLGITRQAVSRLVRNGTLRSVTFRGVKVIPLSEFEGAAGRTTSTGKWLPYNGPDPERQEIGRRVARERLDAAAS